MRLEIGISMLTVCSAFSQDVNVRILIPERTFVLSQPDSKVKVREVHATSDALWFLVQDKDARFRLLATDFGGNLKTSASISTDNAVGLTSTSKGIATVIAKGKQRVLTEFDLRGSVVSETALGCYGSESLFSIDGNPTNGLSRWCVNAALTDAPVGAPVELDSPGSIVEQPVNKQILIVDQATGRALLKDFETNSISVISARIPEIEEALEKTRLIYEPAEKERRQDRLQWGKCLW